jgi:hypothetical protein
VATRSSVSVLLLAAAAAGAIGTSCGGDEFCAEGSYECSGTGGTSGNGGSSGTDTVGGTGNGGSTAATGGGSATGGSSATGGGAGMDGGAAGTGTGGSAGSAASGGMTGASGTDNGGAGEGGSTSGPPACDPDAPAIGCVLTPGDGIFVATTGNDSAAGTQAKPLKTIAKAVVMATASGKPIYVCTGTYAEHLRVSVDDLSLSGGYSCAGSTWTYDATRATVAPATVGEARYS